MCNIQLSKRIYVVCVTDCTTGIYEIIIMKKKIFALVAILLATGVATAHAARTWSSSIYWFNPSGTAGTAQVNYLQPDGIVFSSNPLAVAPWGSGTLPQGVAPAGFSGSAVVSSDLPLLAVYRQEGAGATITAPALTTSGDDGRTGLGILFVPAVTLAAKRTTLVTIQNMETEGIVLDLSFLPTGTADAIPYTPAGPVPAGAAARVDLADIRTLGAAFNGSLVITARTESAGSAARVAAAVQALPRSGYKVYAYEAAPGAAVMNLPQAQCSLGTTITRTSFDVQNAGDADAEVSVDYYYTTRGGGVTTVHQASYQAGTAAPGRKLTVNTCSAVEVQGKKNLTAVITARDLAGGPVPLLATGSVIKTTVGTAASFTGLPAPAAGADGTYRVALPMVRWTGGTSGYQTTVTIMNTNPVAGVAPPPAVVTQAWYSENGAVTRQTIRVHTRATTTPRKAGALNAAGTFKGAVVLESSEPIAALAAMKNVGTTLTGAYSSIVLP
jgi:hypothetical protein